MGPLHESGPHVTGAGGRVDRGGMRSLLFGISFGKADPAASVNTFRMGRVPLERSVVLHGTPGVLDERSSAER
ncbi:predicted protein [Streptomyces viridochromogenes DSM 40736]|uniref:Predicted protein n=1 Tax=Streptomyces viridochromogenes (strain DSM 40736 / JCM 4977 / BCRC 1201 / Tue 494) TaxID=591159 RepID=D9X1R0_STRVT|nr:predicted protein [Streptomyces viridochromogenes DSM 40736]